MPGSPVSAQGGAQRAWCIGRRHLDLSRPLVMGILNVTPDSFSDGSRYNDVDRAVERALQLEEEGADILDIGGESTRPYAPPVTAAEELKRVVPVIERLSGQLRIPISIDTFKAETAAEALAAGAEIVNDIGALRFDERMAATVADAGAGLVLMHSRGGPAEMQRNTEYTDLVSEVIDYLRQSFAMARVAGIPAECVVVDPGIGFAKSVAGNLELLRRLPDLAVLDLPILVGTSRKSFIGTVLGREVGERLFGTAATMALAVAGGASVFRVHDVREMRDVVDMAAAVLGAGRGVRP